MVRQFLRARLGWHATVKALEVLLPRSKDLPHRVDRPLVEPQGPRRPVLPGRAWELVVLPKQFRPQGLPSPPQKQRRRAATPSPGLFKKKLNKTPPLGRRAVRGSKQHPPWQLPERQGPIGAGEGPHRSVEAVPACLARGLLVLARGLLVPLCSKVPRRFRSAHSR